MRSVFFLSDQTGITTESMGNALLTQFNEISLRKERMPFIDTEFKADIAIVKIQSRFIQDGERPIILSSIVNPIIRNKFKLECVCFIDFFETFMPELENALEQKAVQAMGKSHGMNDQIKYYRRIDAIDFSLQNDDGITVKNYEAADVILVGVSRVGKTPTCLYLAVNYGIKAANYPFAEVDLKHDKLPKILVPYHEKLFGLSINVDRLHQIRQNRIPNSNYANINTCKTEIEAAEHVMREYGIPFLNTSEKSIEEIASNIMQRIHLVRKF
ncbi:MAG: phosphoenolpyruvate synthase regulatory protein [Burkholderiales bacterium]|jgi:regulator of PEP synthase PpsR (kinase-PPPase family)|nr:phosphoenolpyruvate synthase regulatory protein [Burkholderiales bacterium]MCE3269441.1 phosphoenolpyruvate synthase regulatory protein [Burkholderiales bacterium]